MRYHDFHLAGYSVRDFGGTISLDLVRDHPGKPREQSTIEFSDVVAYHFVHTGAAILHHIGEETIESLLGRLGSRLAEWFRLHGGYQFWDDDLSKYRAKLKEEGYRAWSIDSAVGFEGFVIAKVVTQREPNPALQATAAPLRC
jgi:chemotaxis methyl-accepting protein methylase